MNTNLNPIFQDIFAAHFGGAPAETKEALMDANTFYLNQYEKEQCDPKYERAAGLADKIEAAKEAVSDTEEALAERELELKELEREYDAVFDGDDYDGSDTVWEAG